MDSTARRELFLHFQGIVVQHLSLEESGLVRGLFGILGLSASLGRLVVRVEVFDHATDHVHYLSVRLWVAQIKRINDARQLEQILDALLVLLRLVILPVHQDVEADLLDEVAVLLHSDSFREALSLLSALTIHGGAAIQKHLDAFTGTCHFLLDFIFHFVVGQYA